VKVDRYSLALLALTLTLLAAHLYTIGLPDKAACYSQHDQAYHCIMDEYYYIPWANSMLRGQQCYLGLGPCHLEHPPLGVALIALGVWAFGDDALGWRFTSMLLGTAGVPLLYLLSLKASGDRRLSLLSALFLSTDTLYFVHSSAALIDVQPTFFLTLSLLLLLRGRPFLAGLSLGLAGLSKESALFGAGALASYVFLSDDGPLRAKLFTISKVALPALATFFMGLQFYDMLYARFVFGSFIDHLAYMLKYGLSLKAPSWYDPFLKRDITPLDWVAFYSPIAYYISRTTLTLGGRQLSVVDVGYYGIYNMPLIWGLYAWVPFVAWGLLRTRASAAQPMATQAARLPWLALCWFLWGYLPYIALFLAGRVTYPFYLLQALPALCLGTSYLVIELPFPRWARYTYILILAFWFFAFYPYKAFLPAWIRALLRI